MALNNKYSLRNISFRLAITYLLSFGLSALCLFAISYFLLERSLENRDHSLLNAHLAESVAVYLKGAIPDLKAHLAIQKQGDEDSQYLVRVEDPNGKTLFLRVPEAIQNLSPAVLETQLKGARNSRFTLHEVDEDDEYEILNQKMTDGNQLQIAKSTDDRDDLLERYRGIIAAASILVILLGGFGGLFFSRQVLSPIRDLILAVRRIQSGDLTARVPLKKSGDELDELSFLFNQMIEKIQGLLSNMQETLDGFSHDFRTPLTRIRTVAELALLKNSTISEYQESLQECLENTREMNNLLNSLMDQAEAEAGVLKLALSPLIASGIITDIVDIYSLVAEDRKIKIAIQVLSDFTFQGDESRTKQALANLLDNAIKYSPEHSQVSILIQEEGGKKSISVIDQGLGILPEEAPKIWNRLYRGDRSRSASGFGLGLSLVKSIIQAHGWMIEVRSTPNEGSQFMVIFNPQPSLRSNDINVIQVQSSFRPGPISE